MISDDTKERAAAIGRALVDQRAARVIVEPYANADGYWFGGGNMIRSDDGTLYVVGRYRNEGDSRTGLAAGARGIELAVFSSSDNGKSFEKILSFDKSELTTETGGVLSIEGAALHIAEDAIELFVSTEKTGRSYPSGLEQYQKPGTGVWSIDLIRAADVRELKRAPVHSLLVSRNPEHLHIKDPVVHGARNGDTYLFFCTHPFSWSSSNSGYAVRRKGAATFEAPSFNLLPRGTTWDVAATRVTGTLPLSAEQSGLDEDVTLLFYDGAECLRPHEQGPNAVKRPRGYSCEEIAGLAICPGDCLEPVERISTTLPMFSSPWGSESSRYIDACATPEGVYATWEQSQSSRAQPLVMNFLSWEQLREAAATGA